MKHTIIGIAMFTVFACVFTWVFYYFMLNESERVFVDNALEIQSPRVDITKKNKPICSQVIVPAGDCIPQHIANLPPDPGMAGMLTLEGVDGNKNGVRDDVEIRIVQKWGDSERAVQALFLVAKYTQTKVKYGGDVTREEAFEISNRTGGGDHIVRCYMLSVPEEIQQDRAMERVSAMVTNTPARFERWRKFDGLLHMQLFPYRDFSLETACGYNPEALNN
jgi:hypothetical protein